MEKEVITSVYRNHHGDIISFQTSSGRIISYRKAAMEAAEEKITGVQLVESEDGIPYFHQDEFEELPSFY
jgi:regulatory protein YycI of two-component signal transduction system YycFG